MVNLLLLKVEIQGSEGVVEKELLGLSFNHQSNTYSSSTPCKDWVRAWEKKNMNNRGSPVWLQGKVLELDLLDLNSRFITSC